MSSNFRENKEENKIILRPSSPTTTNNMEREWVGGTQGGIEDSLPTLSVSIGALWNFYSLKFIYLITKKYSLNFVLFDILQIEVY